MPLLTALMILAFSSPASPKEPVKNAPASLEFHNLVQDFDVFWRQEREAAASAQVEAFRKRIVPQFPQFYSYKIESWRKQAVTLENALSEELKEYPNYRDRFLNAGAKLPIYLSKALESFQKRFPDFHGIISTYIIHSFNEMDGGTRDLDGKNYLIFGAESIAKYHSSQDFERKIPFLHHELFHIYHRAFFQERESLADGLWAEGLAVLAAKELNPIADLAQLSLDNPKDLLEQCTNLKTRLIADLKERMKMPKTDDYGTYFLGNSKHPWIPKRAGYCLGFEIAQAARKKKPLHELARFDRASIKRSIHDYLSNQ